MKDKRIFPQLAGTRIEPPLSPSEIEAMWRVVQHDIRKPKGSRIPFYLVGLAASIVLAFFLWLASPQPIAPPPTQIAMATPATFQDMPPLIEEWEGSPSLMYEGEHDTVKVAFIVDQSVTW